MLEEVHTTFRLWVNFFLRPLLLPLIFCFLSNEGEKL